MRHLLGLAIRSKSSMAAPFSLLLLLVGLLAAQPAAAQIPDVPIVGYGQTIPGEITSPNAVEHVFTGCVDEIVGVSVTANDFSPRLEIYGPEDEVPLASATAPIDAGNSAANRSVVLEGIRLPTSGLYTLLVSGRSRGDRGGYSVTLQGTTLDDVLLDDGRVSLNLLYGQVVTGSVSGGSADHWNFRGCEGDEIRAEIEANDFNPKLELLSPIAEFPIATVEPETNGDDAHGEFQRALPDSGYYNLIVSGASATSAGDYSLSFTLEGRATTPTPVVISELSPTPTPTLTATSGPRVRRGTPVPRSSTTPVATPTQVQGPTPTIPPTPTPEFTMPGMGESAFSIFDVSSEGGPVNHVAYSPDGSVLATAGEDGAVRAWDSFTGELLKTMEGHEDRVNFVAFSPNGSWLASAGDDGTVRLWDEEGVESAILEMPDNQVTSVAFSPDSTSLVATTAAGDVVVWDVAEKSVRFALEGNEGPVYAATYSPDGTLLATGDGVGVVRLWDANEGTRVDALPLNAGPGGGDPVLSLAFSRDGTALVVGGVQGINAATVQIWDLNTGDRIGELLGHTEWGSIASISPDDAYIFSAGRAEPGHDGPVSATARIWNAATGKLAIALVGYPSSVVAAAFSPDGDEVMTSDGFSVYIWPGQMIDVFAAAFGEAIGVQIPTPTVTPNVTPTEEIVRPRRTPNATATATRAPTPTLIPTATLTPESTGPTISLEIFCTVITDRLNLRPGPGTNFNPPITVLETGEILVVTGRNADGSWVQVAVLDENLEPEFTGWVSVDFLFCVGEIDDAPVVNVP